MLRLDFPKVYNKGRNFLIRNQARILRWSHHIWHEIKHIGKGFKTFKQEIQESVTDTKDMHYARYKKVTYSQSKKMQRVTRDVIKFIPFSLFIIIPGLELLLPAWLVIFPNAIPSQFQSAATRQKKMEQLLTNRNQAAEKLLYKLPKYLHKLAKSNYLTEEEKLEMQEVLKLVETNDSIHTNLLKYKHLFTKYADFKHFKVSTLQDMAHFMGLNPITGLNTINNILSFTGIKIRTDNMYVSWMTKIILKRELRMFFRKIRREDSYLSMEKVSNFTDARLDSILIERGIEILNKPRDKKLKDYKMWQAISNLNNVPDSLLIFCRLNEFAEDLYRINYFEQEIDLIRRVSSSKGYIQRKRRLEEYLGMAQVKDCISHLLKAKGLIKDEEEGIEEKEKDLQEQTEETKTEKWEHYTPVFTIDDYRNYKNAVQEFKIRHNAIVSEVDNLNSTLAKQLEELEQIVILGYLDRKEMGEHSKIRDLNPNIERIKQRMLEDANEDATSSKFKRLIELSQSLSKDKDFETELKRHGGKDESFI